MDNKMNIPDIPAEKFRMVQLDERIHDVKFTTKPVGYFKDALRRFYKNKSSVVAAYIILFLLLFAFFGPLFSQYSMTQADGIYAKCRPINAVVSELGFWDGGYSKTLNDKYLIFMAAIGAGAEDKDGSSKVSWDAALESNYSPIISMGEQYAVEGVGYRNAKINSYNEVGFMYQSVTMSEYEKIQAWQEENGITVLYPMVDINSEYCDAYNRDNANYWYRHTASLWPIDENDKKMTLDKVIENGLTDNYLRDGEGNVQYFLRRDTNMVMIRVLVLQLLSIYQRSRTHLPFRHRRTGLRYSCAYCKRT